MVLLVFDDTCPCLGWCPASVIREGKNTHNCIGPGRDGSIVRCPRRCCLPSTSATAESWEGPQMDQFIIFGTVFYGDADDSCSVRVCARPVSPVTMLPELSSVSQPFHHPSSFSSLVEPLRWQHFGPPESLIFRGAASLGRPQIRRSSS